MEDNNSSNENYPQRQRKSLFFPLLLLTAGVLLLLSNFGYLPGGLWGFVEMYWPVLLIVSGLDGLIRGNGITGSLLIAGFGGLLLAGNLGYITLSAWEMLIKGWPFILIAAGLDIIIGRRTAIRSVFALVMAFVLIAGLVWIADLSIPGSTHTEEFQQKYQNESSLNLDISRSAGKVELISGGNDSMLVDAELNLLRNENVEPEVEQGTDTTVVRLGNDQNKFPGTSRPMQNSSWEIKVNAKPELTFKSVVLMGENELDFRGLDVKEVHCETITGKSDVYISELPGGIYKISGATGKITIHVPEGTPVRIDANKAIGALILPGGFSEKNGWIVSSDYKDGEAATEVTADLPIGAIQIIEYSPSF